MVPPCPPDQSDHRGKKRTLPLGKSGRAVYTNFWIPDPPPPPPSNISLPSNMVQGMLEMGSTPTAG